MAGGVLRPHRYRCSSGRPGLHGNRVDSFLTTMHDGATNPVRLVQVDTRANSLKTWLYAPWTQTSYPQYTEQLRGRTWLR